MAPGASIYVGRNEDGGLACIYHGRKFDELPVDASLQHLLGAFG